MGHTLSQIIEFAKANKPLDIEEARRAICMLTGLSTFDTHDLMKIADKANRSSDLKVAQMYATSLWEESFKRWKLALAREPKDWLGWENDPANKEYQDRRVVANKILEKGTCWRAAESD